MKQEMNKEMDLLLRRLSRRQDGSLPADSSTVGEHLDTDELTAYAEKVLPAAACARYTTHIADCASCRELVVQLSSSMNVVAAARIEKAAGPSWLRTFLASLFSPMVLRYAVPALGLVVVAAIGFYSLRRQPDHLASQPNKPSANANAASLEVNLDNYQQAERAKTNTSSATDAEVPAQAKRSLQADAVPPPNTPPAVSINSEVKKDEPLAKTEQVAANSPVAQPTPTSAAPIDEVRKAEAEAPKETSQRAANELPKQQRSTTTDFATAEDRRAQEGAGAGSRAEESKKSKAAAPAAGTTLGLASAARRQRDGSDKSDDAETRSIAGRQFRKARGIWIDTGYSSGARTVNLTRGSEQYRALVADEPSIKTIADQLDGEIIVVWKGRAYRIR